MRTWVFARRSFLEIIRDPISVSFLLGFPTVLLLLLSAIQAHVPASLFAPEHLTPGITVFGLAFVSLFSATLIARDRESAFLQRLYATPMTAWDFLLGYTLPLLPLAVGQSVVCYLIAFPLGLAPTWSILSAVLCIAPVSLLYIAIGLLCGSVMTVKQVGGVCGALLTNVSAWLSGVWFDLDLVGGTFKKIAYVLPFVHAVELERAVLRGDWAATPTHWLVVMLYAAVLLLLAVLLFIRQAKK